MFDIDVSIFTTYNSLLDQLEVYKENQPPHISVSISEMCNELKKQGRRYEESLIGKLYLEKLAERMRLMCSDTSIPAQFRLHLLEVLEHKSMGWSVDMRNDTPIENHVEDYGGCVSKETTGMSIDVGELGINHKVIENEVCRIDDDAVQEVIRIGSVQLFLSSTDKDVMVAAKRQLEEFFSITPTSPPLQQYSREMILGLANSQLSLRAPVNWARRVQYLPSVVVRQV